MKHMKRNIATVMTFQLKFLEKEEKSKWGENKISERENKTKPD